MFELSKNNTVYLGADAPASGGSIDASVYKPAGSVAFASLPTLSASVLGNVYNVTDAFTTTADFVEGAGKSYPAGTNVAVVEPSTGTYKFDALSGMIPTMTGATSGAAGTSGLVPAPAAGDQAKFLTGAGTWGDGIVNNVASTAVSSKSMGLGIFTQSKRTNSIIIGNNITVDDSSSPSYTQRAIAIGESSKIYKYMGIALGCGAKSNGQGAMALGPYSEANNNQAVAIGGNTTSSGANASGISSIAIGDGSYAKNTYSIAIGPYSKAGDSNTDTNGIAIGGNATAKGSYAIQIGKGTNSTANTFSVGLDASHNYQLLDANGQIPAARLPEGTPTTAVITSYTGVTGSTLTSTASGTISRVYKNGTLLTVSTDYTVSSTTITFTTALVSTDVILVETAGGITKLIKITQSAYTALETASSLDANAFYLVVADPV